MRKTMYALAVLLLLSVSVSHAAPQDGPRPPSARQQQGKDDPCRPDVEKLCSDVVPGGGRIIMCLESKRDKLSPACREKLDRGKERFKNAKKACDEDVRKFCANVQPGEGRILMCMKENYEKLSPKCKETFEEARRDSKDWAGPIHPRGETPVGPPPGQKDPSAPLQSPLMKGQ